MNTSTTPQEPILQDAALQDERDLGEKGEKPHEPKELVETLLNDWEIAEQMRDQAIKLEIITQDQNEQFTINDNKPTAQQLREDCKKIRHDLLQNPSTSQREALEQELGRLYIEFAYNTTLLLKKNFHSRLSQLVSEAQNQDNTQTKLEKVETLIELVKDSGLLLIRLKAFKDDTEKIFDRLEDVHENNDVHQQLSDLNIILYQQLEKSHHDLPAIQESQASVLPKEIGKLTDVNPDSIADLLESLEQYRHKLLNQGDSTPRIETTSLNDLAPTDPVQAEVEETFGIGDENQVPQSEQASRTYQFPENQNPKRSAA